ncbi:MAG: hypothetical protein QM630_02200 [Microbacterium sp.]
MILISSALSGCAPTPEPTPTAAFASEEEAFAAAEEVYREYNEAENARIRGEDEPDPQDFLIGIALEDDIDGIELLRGNGVELVGHINLVRFIAKSASIKPTETVVTAVVCLNIAETRVIGANGTDVTPSARPSVVAQEITMTYVDDSFVILKQAESDASSC